MIGDVRHLLSPGIFFGNLFFVQTILTPVLGSDGALWSLAYEFWYYLLFPLGALAFWRRTPLVPRIVFGVLFAASAWFVRGTILEYFPVWLAGAALFKAPIPTFSATVGKRLRIVATVVYFAIFFGLGRLQGQSPLLLDYILMAATVGYLWILLSHTEAFTPSLLTVRGSREAARFSYTLYAAHTPILVLLASLLEGDSRWVPTGLHILYGLGVLAAVIAYAWGIATVTEFRTDSVRIGIEKLFGVKAAPSVLPSNPLASGEPRA
jgi:peptidoglycan/LPS O-acetylase OafA/YrhL